MRFPYELTLGGKQERIALWDDGAPVSRDPSTGEVVRLIGLTKDIPIKANYAEVKPMANVTFTGTATPVTAGPRSITIIVTLPDGVTKDTLPAVNTDAAGNFTTSKQYLAGTYSAVANAAADSLNKAGASPSVPFTVELTATTVTLNVTVI